MNGHCEAAKPPKQSHGAAARLLRTRGLLAMTALFAGCASPEAGRTPSHPGADVKNWGHPVEFHAGAEPYHGTPCVTEGLECHGPSAVFGATPPAE